MTAREGAALSAMGAALAAHVERWDVLVEDYPLRLVDEANYALRARGLRIARGYARQWKVVGT